MSEDTDLKPVAAIQTPDGVLHATEADAQAHLENVKIAPVIRNFLAYKGVKGRGVRVTIDTVMNFLRWNRAGQPAPAPVAPKPAPAPWPAPEANQETPPVEEPAAE
jgi:hypothetical protein